MLWRIKDESMQWRGCSLSTEWHAVISCLHNHHTVQNAEKGGTEAESIECVKLPWEPFLMNENEGEVLPCFSQFLSKVPPAYYKVSPPTHLGSILPLKNFPGSTPGIGDHWLGLNIEFANHSPYPREVWNPKLLIRLHNHHNLS